MSLIPNNITTHVHPSPLHPHHKPLTFSFQYGETPLFIACLSGHLEVVTLLINKGAGFNTPNKVCLFSCSLWGPTQDIIQLKVERELEG